MTTLIKCKDCAYMGDKEDMATGYCLGCYMLSKAKEKVKKIKTESEARQYAIDWQNWSSEKSLSYRELFEWGAILTKLAEKFDLVEEFHENGII
jgi:hypothetical protein